MDSRSHILLNKLEIRDLRLHQIPAGTVVLPGTPWGNTPPPTGWYGGLIFNTTVGRAYLDIHADGSQVAAWGPTGSWRRLLIEGEVTPTDISLKTDNIFLGVANRATEVPLASIARSVFARPIADVPWGTTGSTLYKITDLHDPDNPQDAATKFYVDQMIQGLKTHESCLCLTVANLACTHAAGVLTGTGNGPIPAASLDNVTPLLGSRVLVKTQTIAAWNGIYVVTQLGLVGYSPWKMTRAADADTGAELLSAFVFIQQGTNYHDTGWVQTEETTAPGWIVGSGDVRWVQFSGSGTYQAGNGLVLQGNSFHFAKVTPYTVGSLFYADTPGTVAELLPGEAFRPFMGDPSVPKYSPYWRLLDTGVIEYKTSPGNFLGLLGFGGITANRTWTLPNYTGVLAGTATVWDGSYRMLLSGQTTPGPGVWSTYGMPLDAVANRLLYSDANKVVTWGVIVPPPNSGTVTLVRKFEAIIQGNNTTTINLTHDLNTRKVKITLRYSDATDTEVTREIVYTQTEVTSVNTVRFTFAEPQLTTRYYAVTIVG